jgi:Arc/MetJ-type ribon-helix-helix transcriptional regulator
MDDGKRSVAVSDRRRKFIYEELASGKYADEAEVVDAALALLERSRRIGVRSALVSEDDEDFERGDYSGFSESGNLSRYVTENAEALRETIAESERSGESARQIPDIMKDVKAKLRSNGAL